MIVGYPPFYAKEPIGIYKKILKGVIRFPKFLSLEIKDLIRKLLNPESEFRLGSLDEGGSIGKHVFFWGVDFDEILLNQIRMPWVPELNGKFDTKYFIKMEEESSSEDNEIEYKDNMFKMFN